MISIKELPTISQCTRRLATNEELNLIKRTEFGVTMRLEENDIIEFGLVCTKRKAYVLSWIHPVYNRRMLLIHCKINGLSTLVPMSMFQKHILEGKMCPILKHLAYCNNLQIAQYLHRKRFLVKKFSTCIVSKFSIDGTIVGQRTIKVPYIVHCK